MSQKIIEMINKLAQLAGNNPNENERIAAALKACALIREHKILGEVKNNVEVDITVEAKEFYQKIVMMNGRPREIIVAKLARCKLCSSTLTLGAIATWIPRTNYIFHPACWSKLKIQHTPR